MNGSSGAGGGGGSGDDAEEKGTGATCDASPTPTSTAACTSTRIHAVSVLEKGVARLPQDALLRAVYAMRLEKARGAASAKAAWEATLEAALFGASSTCRSNSSCRKV